MPQLSRTRQPPDELDVFHHRQAGQSPLKNEHLTSDKHALVAIGQVEPPHPSATPRSSSRACQAAESSAKLKLPATARWPVSVAGYRLLVAGWRLAVVAGFELTERVKPTVRDDAVSVQEPQPVAGRLRRPGVELCGPARGAVNPLDVHALAGQCANPRVAVASHRDDDLHLARRVQLRQKPSQRFGIVAYRDDDGDQWRHRAYDTLGARMQPEQSPRLLSLISHELRGPLGVIRGYLRLLEQTGPELSDSHRQAVTAALKASDRAAELLTQTSMLASCNVRRRRWPCRPTPLSDC